MTEVTSPSDQIAEDSPSSPHQSEPDSAFASQAVRVLLAVSGLTPSPAEIDAFVAGFLPSREEIAALYDVAEARYEEPAVRFSAELR
jgi:hypothetical protein